MNKIIAIVGMCGTGKSVACEYLESLGYKIIHFGDVTFDKLNELGLEINPENEKMMREKLRKELGMAAYAISLLPKIEDFASRGNVVLDGLYSWDELKVLEEKFSDMKVVAIITDKSLRYERLSQRDIRPFTKDEAKYRDITEIENIAKGGPIAYADYFVQNNGSKEEMINRINNILKSI